MKEFLSIQYLRGLAAIMVVVYHLAGPLALMGYTGKWPKGLSGGVDVFFVISGFVMWMTTRARAVSPAKFWWRRITRIVPLYWLATTLMLAVLLVAPHALQSSAFDLRHVLASYAMLPYPHPVKAVMEPLVFPGWSLNFEMFFYFVFGLFLFARPSFRLWGTGGVLLLLVGLGRVLSPQPLTVAGFYTSSIMIEFFFGMILGEIVYRRGEGGILNLPMGAVLVVTGLFTILILPDLIDGDRLLRMGLPALAIVVGALAMEGAGAVKDWRLPHFLGNASYSIYLTQLFTLAVFALSWKKFPFLDTLPCGMVIYSVGAVVSAAVVGCLCYVLVEKPINRAFKRGTRSFRDQAALS